jgi:2-aminomuconate deaminase
MNQTTQHRVVEGKAQPRERFPHIVCAGDFLWRTTPSSVHRPIASARLCSAG